MSKVLVTEDYLEDIADAIRGKLSSSDTYTPGQMAGAIESIPTGGITPTGTINITENGSVDVTQYATANVNVSGGGGDTYAFIIATYAAGATCTASNGTITLTAPDTSGTAVFAIPTPASTPETWTITQTLAGATGSTTVSVSQHGASYAVNVPGLLPLEYTRVEYLEVGSTAGPYINTGVANNSTAYFEITGQYTSAPGNNEAMFGAATSIGEYVVNAWGGAFFVAGTSHYTTFTATDKNTYAADSDGMSVNGMATGTAVNWSVTSGLNYCLFAMNYGGSIYKGRNVHIYGCKLYSGTSIVREFIPCYRNADNEPGMYDSINGVFYTNDGTGSFAVGPDA